jgi:hypothetical protein
MENVCLVVQLFNQFPRFSKVIDSTVFHGDNDLKLQLFYIIYE